LVLQAFAYREMLADRMRAARFAVAAKQRVFGSFDEDERNRMLATKELQQRRQFLELRTFSSIDEQGGAGETAITGGVQLSKNRNEFDRKIVDAVEAHVLERFEDGAFAGAGKAGKNDKLPRLGGGRLGSARAAQLFTLRWCVLGMRISSRYLA